MVGARPGQVGPVTALGAQPGEQLGIGQFGLRLRQHGQGGREIARFEGPHGGDLTGDPAVGYARRRAGRPAG